MLSTESPKNTEERLGALDKTTFGGCIRRKIESLRIDDPLNGPYKALVAKQREMLIGLAERLLSMNIAERSVNKTDGYSKSESDRGQFMWDLFCFVEEELNIENIIDKWCSWAKN